MRSDSGTAGVSGSPRAVQRNHAGLRAPLASQVPSWVHRGEHPCLSPNCLGQPRTFLLAVSLDEMRLLLHFPNGAFTCTINLIYLLGGNKRIPCTETQHCALGLQALLHWGNWGWAP